MISARGAEPRGQMFTAQQPRRPKRPKPVGVTGLDTKVTKPVDLAGQVIGSYHITSRLGRGGMADVYKALHTDLKVHRAIKFIRPEFVTSEDFVARFQKEAQAVAKLEHPNIVRIHDFGNVDNQFFMVMQFVDGLDLKHHLANTGAIDADDAIDLVVPIAAALSYAHERDLIHRDIKPENIMLGEKNEPILMDFGIAKLLTESTALTQTGVGIGTPAYMAPEQAQGLAITPATDIYALTVVLYELVTGRQPYSADTPIAVMLKAISDPLPLPRDINPAISEELQAVILKGTAKDPLARYQSADEFAADLRSVRGGSQPTIARTAPVSATAGATNTGAATVVQGTGATTPPSAGAKFVRAMAWVGGLALLSAAGAGYWWWNSAVDPEALSATPDLIEEGSPQAISTPTAPQPAPAGNSLAAPGSNAAPPAKKRPAPVQQLIGGAAGVIYEYRETLTPGEVVESTLTLEKGEAVYLRMHKAEQYTDVKLMQPDGRKELFSSYNNAGPFVAKTAGDHRLSMKLRGQEAGAVDMQIIRINPAVKAAGEITFNDYTAGSTEWPGQRLNYQVDLTKGDTLYLEVLQASNYTDFTLRSLDDRKDIFSSYNNSGTHDIPTTGVYEFYADPRGEKLTNYEFILHKLNPAVIDGGDYPLNSWAEAATTQPGQRVSYTLSLKTDDVVFLEVTKASNYTDFVLKTPGGRDTVFSSYNDTGPHKVNKSGVYSLMADPRGAKLSEYEFKLHRLAPAVIQGGAVTLDQPIRASTKQPGQIAQYELTLTQPTNVAMEVISASNYTDFTLKSPDGRSNIFSSYSSVAAKPLAAGKYRFIVDPRNSKTSDFEFRLSSQP